MIIPGKAGKKGGRYNIRISRISRERWSDINDSTDCFFLFDENNI